MKEWIAFVLTMIICACALIYTANLESDCSAKGGVLVKGIWAPKCFVGIKEIE